MLLPSEIRAAWIRRNWRDIVYRVAVAVLLAAWLRLFPIYLLTIYLAEKGIPPLEAVSDDLPGIHVVLVWTFIFLVVMAIYQWLPLTLWGFRRLQRAGAIQPTGSDADAVPPKPSALDSKALWGFAWVASGLVWLALGTVILNEGPMPRSLIFAFSIFSLLLNVSLFLFIRGNVRHALTNWRGPLAFIGISLVMPVIAHDEVADVIDSSLRRYRVGGMLPVTIEPVEQVNGGATSTLSGKLLLLGKRNIYIEVGEGSARELIVIVNSQNLKVTIGQQDRVL